MTQVVFGSIFDGYSSVADHFFHQSVVMGQSVKSSLTAQVATSVSDMGNEQHVIQTVGQCQCRPHTAKFRPVLRFGQHAGVRFSEGCLKVRQHLVLFRLFEFREPLESLQDECLHRVDGHGARLLAACMTAHAIGDDEQVAPVRTTLNFPLR